MTTIPDITLNNGVAIPQIGFGVFQVPPDETRQAVLNALDAGYRHIDTARNYDNEQSVGEAIAEFGVDRDDIFVTTKCWNADQGYDKALAAFDASMERLGLDQLDLYLIHWPCPAKDLFVDTWRAFEKLYSDGRVRAIGVSNFRVEDLGRILDSSDVVPAVNQIELHPWLPQDELRQFHSEHGIATEAWSPIARGGEHLSNAILKGLASKHGKSVAQIILRWQVQLGNIPLPRTVNAGRAVENRSVYDFELDDSDMQTIASLANGMRVGPDPAEFNVDD